MAKIQGIGGIFMYAENPESLAQWYQSRFDLKLQNWGSCFGMILPSKDLHETPETESRQESLVFSIMKAENSVETKTARLNWRVSDLKAMKAKLIEMGESFEEKEENSEFGWFAWLNDPEGNRIELWQPPLKSEG